MGASLPTVTEYRIHTSSVLRCQWRGTVVFVAVAIIASISSVALSPVAWRGVASAAGT